MKTREEIIEKLKELSLRMKKYEDRYDETSRQSDFRIFQKLEREFISLCWVLGQDSTETYNELTK